MYYNKNKGLIACLALLLSMVVGYALFSDDIEINASGETKGDFSYEITTMKGIDPAIKTSDMYAVLNNYGTTGAETSFGSEEGILDSSITSSGNVITYSANFTAPLQSQYFTIKITNTGSIPFTIEHKNINSSTLDATGTVDVDDGTTYTLEDLSSGSAWKGDNLQWSQIVYAGYWLGFEKIQDIYVSKKAYTNMENANSSAKIENGESAYLIIYMHWRDIGFTINGKTVVGADATLNYTREIPIKQYLD